MQYTTTADWWLDELGDEIESYTLVPVIGEPGEFVAVFADGSYTRWAPDDSDVTERRKLSGFSSLLVAALAAPAILATFGLGAA